MNVRYGASHSIFIFILLLLSPYFSLFLFPSPSANIFLSILLSLADTILQGCGQCFAGGLLSCKSVSDHISCSEISTLKYKFSSYLKGSILHHRSTDQLDNIV
jgi:hypothetical protein